MGNLITFGATENPFNSKMVKLLNESAATDVKKIPGSSFKRGLPDIEGFFFDGFCALENKFIHKLPDTIRGDTEVLKSDAFSSHQRAYFRDKMEAFRHAKEDGYHPQIYLGGLIGVNRAPKCVIGVPASFITEFRSLTSKEVRDYLQLAEVHKTPYVNYQHRFAFSSVTTLVRSLRCL